MWNPWISFPSEQLLDETSYLFTFSKHIHWMFHFDSTKILGCRGVAQVEQNPIPGRTSKGIKSCFKNQWHFSCSHHPTLRHLFVTLVGGSLESSFPTYQHIQCWMVGFIAFYHQPQLPPLMGGWVWFKNNPIPWWPSSVLSQNGHQGQLTNHPPIQTSLSCSPIHASLDLYDTSAVATTQPSDIFL